MSTETRELHHDPEREQRLSLRAEYVMTHYLVDHPETALREDVESGRTSLERAYQILKETGGRDPKTGVNRADVLKYALEFELYQTRETGEPTTVAVFDIDNFKQINSELGHVQADDVLRRVAETISHEVRQSDDILPIDEDEDSVVRWGGEEFVVIFSRTNRQAAHIAADRIRTSIVRTFADLRPDGRSITVSGGLAEASSTDRGDYLKLLQAADEQLLAAKANGKNVIFPTPEVSD